MKKIQVILIGAGDRGTIYSDLGAELCPDEFELVGVADPDPVRRNYIRDRFRLPESSCHASWETLLAEPKHADVAIIATQDKQHFAPAMKAISQGYHLLLEKPVATTPEECLRISEAAQAKGVKAVVCHVLRFTPFFQLIKKLVDEDRVGRIINIIHVECVGNVHQSHSFVRGNWRRSEDSSPMILAKSCHDLDVLQWLIGEKCTRVQSFGSLSYFRRENMPEGAPEYCYQGCPAGDECPYNTHGIYVERNFPPFVQTATRKHNPTDEDIRRAVTETGYGRCVFRCDNDVVDHQVVNLEYEGGATVSFTMSAFNKGGRKIRIMGTKGELNAEAGWDHVDLFDFATRTLTQVKIDENLLNEALHTGHGGGDRGIVRAFCAYINGNYRGNSISEIGTSVENHMTAFAAEESRLRGIVISMADYIAELGRTGKAPL